MFNRYLGQRTPEKDEDRLLVSLMAKGLPPEVTSGGFGKIIVIHANDGGVEVFDPTDAGFTSALSAANGGDAVWLPAATISGDHTIPGSVGVQAYGKKTDLTGTITLSSGSMLQSCYVLPVVSSGDPIVGVIGPSSGRAYIVDCSVIATNNGSGDAYAVNHSGGILWLWSSTIEAETAGPGDAYAVNYSAPVYHWFCRFEAITANIDTNPFNGSFTITITDSVPDKGLSLWNGGGNDAPPADWETVGFDDSGWDTPAHQSGNYYWVAAMPPQDNTEEALFRYTFYLPVMNITDGSITVVMDDDSPGMYVNGNLVWDDDSGTVDAPSVVDVTAYLLPNAKNVIAIHGKNVLPPGANVNMVLTVEETAEITGYASQIYNYDGVKATTPELGDRSAWDVADFEDLHARDIYDDALVRHLPNPVGEDDNDIAYVDTDEWVIGSAAEAGITSEPPDPSDPYWEPAVDADGYDIMFTDDGDIAMVWVE